MQLAASTAPSQLVPPALRLVDPSSPPGSQISNWLLSKENQIKAALIDRESVKTKTVRKGQKKKFHDILKLLKTHLKLHLKLPNRFSVGP